MTSADWLLLSVDLARPRVLQPVQLQKVLFLLDRKLTPHQKKVERIYDFAPYDYGPFDAAIYDDAERFAFAGDMEIHRFPGQSFKQYGVSESGHLKATGIAAQLDAPVVEYAEKLVRWVQSLSFNQLVSAVYREFPDMKVNSVFKG